MRAEPIQARAIRTRDRILEAAREVYAEKGRDEFDTNLVAARAGCAIGTVYRYFENRVDLMDAIAPDRDYPSLKVLEKAALYGYYNGGEIPNGNAREVVEFFEAAL